MSEHVVVVEDEAGVRELLEEVLAGAGYRVTGYGNGSQALEALARGLDADLVITDLRMPGIGGEQLLAELRTRRPEVNVVVITAFGSIESAIGMVKAGAYDYLTKPFGSDELLLTVQRAMEESRLRREVSRLARGEGGVPGMVGASRAMREVTGLIARVAPSPLPVLVTGESGTGKELVARAIHRASGLDAFVAVNCAALPDDLLESELFGHERGAFSGAVKDKPGLFEAADGGVLFLDEIGDLPLPLQPKLLRALESGEIRRVGSTSTRIVKTRVIAATNKDLEALVREGQFREDLFWRLNVLSIHVPALRERPADIALLVEHFAGGLTVSPEAMARLTAHPWPGNVRELRNVLERAITLRPGTAIALEDLPAAIATRERDELLVSGAQQDVPLRDVERSYILMVLERTGGNKSRAAEILGLDRKTLYRKLDEFGYRDPGEAKAPSEGA
ncbi:MAG: sigma-54 dependent transcriptional regulator [Gemmatimonadota bacterium]